MKNIDGGFTYSFTACRDARYRIIANYINSNIRQLQSSAAYCRCTFYNFTSYPICRIANPSANSVFLPKTFVDSILKFVKKSQPLIDRLRPVFCV